MNLVADEGVDRAVVERLREDDHHVAQVAELSPSTPDEDVLRQANARSAILITADKDFGNLVFRQRLVHFGVILLRLSGLPNTSKAEIVAAVFLQRQADRSGSPMSRFSLRKYI